MNLSTKNIEFIARVKDIIKVHDYGNGLYEVYATCKLTERNVIRYFGKDFKVFEFNDRLERWGPLEDGVCRIYRLKNE